MFRKSVTPVFLLVVALCASPALSPQSSPAQPSGSGKNSTLNVTVTDQNHHSVSGLKAENFKLFIDNQPQPISSVSGADAATCLGLVLDTSGSMRPRHGDVIKTMLDLVRTANPQGQTFVVNFNDSPYLDQELTRNFDWIHEGLNHGDPRGGTALYEAVIASADYVTAKSQCDRRVLVLVTDGEDNESNKTLEQTIREVQRPNSPVIYVMLIAAEKPRARRAMETLALATGGQTFSGGLKQEVKDVAEEMSKQYTITFRATDDRSDGTFRAIRVEAQSTEQAKLLVRRPAGYYAGAPSKAVAPPSAVAVKPAPVPIPSTTRTPAASQLPNFFNCVTGRVVDENNLPLEGMTVRATPDNGDTQPSNSSTPKSLFARSGPNGTFRFTGITPGSYRLSAFNISAGYPSPAIPLYGGSERTQQVSVSAAQGCSDVVLNAGPKAARLRLKVVELGTGNEVRVFSVILRREDIPTVPFTIRGDPEHDLLLPPLAEVTLQVQASGYNRSDAHVVKSGPSDSSQELTVELRPAFPRL